METCRNCGSDKISTGYTCERCGYRIESAELDTLRAQLATAQARIAELEAARIAIAGELPDMQSWLAQDRAIAAPVLLREVREARNFLDAIRRALAGEQVESEDETVAKVAIAIRALRVINNEIPGIDDLASDKDIARLAMNYIRWKDSPNEP